MKKIGFIVVLVLFSVTILTTTCAFAALPVSTEVCIQNENSLTRDEFLAVVYNELFNVGVPDGVFDGWDGGGSQCISRADVAWLLDDIIRFVRQQGGRYAFSVLPVFYTDSSTWPEWAYDAIVRAQRCGMISVMAGRLFNPNDSISLTQVERALRVLRQASS